MPLIECRFKSKSLECDTNVHVILPEKPDSKTSTLYLLHGLSDDETAWCRKTAIERYVQDLPLAVVMPGAGRSFYQDMHHGDAYWTFVSEELPGKIRDFFKLPQARSRTFAAGLSMGGYGAFRLALTHPDRFAAAASLSGALDIARVSGAKNPRPDLSPVFSNAFGEKGPRAGSLADLFHLAAELAKSGVKAPKLFQCCGKQDYLIEHSRGFHQHLTNIGLAHEFIEDEGSHDWAYWDFHIQRVLKWLPIVR